jgi:pyruvate dehydrogenase E2 component (dihydrolipoamide acetyltransferase)
MEEGTIVKWQKKEGDSVSSGDVLCEVETDKATMDYESTQEGTLLKIVRGDGSSSKVGEAIGIIGEKGEDVSDLVKSIEAGSGPAAAEKAAAAEPEKAQKAAASAEKATASAEKAPASESQNGQRPAAAAEQRSAAPAQGGGVALAAPGVVKASPLARKIAGQKGYDIRQIRGTGPEGRIVRSDVESFDPSKAAPVAQAGSATVFAPAPGRNVDIPVAGKRAVIARRLAESKFSAPHYYLKSTVEMARVIEARKMLNGELPEKVSFNAFMLKFAAEALKRHPNVNASWQGDHITQFGSIDIGLAVDLGNGLMTPVVRNCGNRGVVDIDRELKSLIQKAGAGKLTPEEYTGATFTISNLGSFGIEEFTAIINPPGSAILALGQLAKVPVVAEGDQIVVREVMKMTLSCDHRVIDGAAGAGFLFELTRMMENPVRALY